jgi:hypothetical protein
MTLNRFQISWHVPTDPELALALEIFKQLVEPSLELLENLLDDSKKRDAVWRNEFCRFELPFWVDDDCSQKVTDT